MRETANPHVFTVTDHQGATRYVVAQWREKSAQYWVPLRASTLSTPGMQQVTHAIGRRLADVWTGGYSYARYSDAVRRASIVYSDSH